ncbi:TPA: hypothetical protein QEK88_000602 [Stenotrophomonas maltophilia]|uniref:oxidoreductase n=1 Tax=Cupriavidus pauculus TaxID=82633 RepID=UPI000A054EEC|nr:hypothetical protein [Cupriavidus pauculus]HDS1530782.1 hypothetical protein [Stenotrophomonas maltophilia]
MDLIITETMPPYNDGQGDLAIPGVHVDEHIKGWLTITEDVHYHGGHFFIQLVHIGRMSLPDNARHRPRAIVFPANAQGAPMFTPARSRMRFAGFRLPGS